MELHILYVYLHFCMNSKSLNLPNVSSTFINNQFFTMESMCNTTCVNYLKSLVIVFFVAITSQTSAEWQTENAAIMGTTIRMEVWHPDQEIRQKGIAQVLEEMEHVNRLMSPYIEQSQLSKINKYAHEGPIKVDQELFALIQKSLEVSKLTQGAFDITYASVGHLYNYRKKIKPTEKEIKQAADLIDYNNIILDKQEQTVFFIKRGVKIDLGGIAKGFAVDQAIHSLVELEIEHALISAGGDTRILGDRLGRPWLVGIRNPKNPDDVIVMLPLQNEALSTSGDYERFFIEDGIKYHHIINPSTGKSASELRSASIIGVDATTTDALSTSVFILGIKAGLQLLDELDGIEGVLVDLSGKLYYSKGLQQYAETPDVK